MADKGIGLSKQELVGALPVPRSVISAPFLLTRILGEKTSPVQNGGINEITLGTNYA